LLISEVMPDYEKGTKCTDLLEEARLRLENTEFPVEQIPYGLGFRDPGYFNRFFKRLTGRAPGAYRQTIATARSTVDAPSFVARS